MKKTKGFTLIELLVTVTIIGILSSIAVVGLTSVREKAQDTSRLSDIRELQLALEVYKSVNGTYPAAGAQGTNAYIVDLAPNFIGKLPTGQTQTATGGFHYKLSTDKKTYCIYVRNIIFKPEAQADLYSSSCAKTWVACKGGGVTALNTDCPGIVSS
jgi:prepilin-type N-terminal cleavage/methylation domain-containing protein